MRNFTNPLDNIRVASPCSADWNQMYRNDPKRFCANCKLNVYNLSEMTRDEAENFLMASEGRVCVRYFRRKDGTVLTKNCPVGWRAVKQRVSSAATAAFSVVMTFLSGLFVLKGVDSAVSIIPLGNVPPVEVPLQPLLVEPPPVAGEVDLDEFHRAAGTQNNQGVWVLGKKSIPQRGKNSQF